MSKEQALSSAAATKYVTAAIILVLTWTMAINAQRRRAGRHGAPAAQPSATPAPSPTPNPTPALTPSQERDIAIGKEIEDLVKLSESDKATVRASIESLERTIRIAKLGGFSVFDASAQKVENILTTAKATLPDGYLSGTMVGAWTALLDADMATSLVHDRIVGDKLLSLIDKYKLGDVPAYSVGPKILNIAERRLHVVVSIAQRAGIIIAAKPQ